MPKKILSNTLPKIGAPATRSLANLGVTKLSQVTRFFEADLLKIHGVGPKAVNILKAALKQSGRSFKK